jgi:hypothetical protein
MNDGQRFLAVVSAVFLAVFAAICFVDGQFIYGTMFLAAAVVRSPAPAKFTASTASARSAWKSNPNGRTWTRATSWPTPCTYRSWTPALKA